MCPRANDLGRDTAASFYPVTVTLPPNPRARQTEMQEEEEQEEATLIIEFATSAALCVMARVPPEGAALAEDTIYKTSRRQ